MGAETLRRVNRAIDFIVGDLARPLRLEEVSKAADYSRFHFHRVFKAVTGEPLQQFVKRQRLERALHWMLHAPKRSLTTIALDCGFSSSSDFTRSFRRRYGSAPSAFDLKAFRRTRRDAFDRIASRESESIDVAPSGPIANPDGFEVALRDLPLRTVAYVRVFDPFREGVVRDASDRLVAWATECGLADRQWLGYMWDEPEITALADCRYDVALVVDAVVPAGEIGRFDFPPMRVAEISLRGDLALETRAIDWLYDGWLPSSGYVPDDQPVFEAWIGRPFAHGSEHFELACQLPVKAAWAGPSAGLRDRSRRDGARSRPARSG